MLIDVLVTLTVIIIALATAPAQRPRRSAMIVRRPYNNRYNAASGAARITSVRFP